MRSNSLRLARSPRAAMPSCCGGEICSAPGTSKKVVVIDGGFRDCGHDVVNHIRTYYKTNLVDVVVSTHPDQDHVNGLHVVLDELDVLQLWIHKPWEHNRGLAEKFHDGRVTDASLGKRLQESLETASDLVSKANRKNIPVFEPFAGLSLYNEWEFSIIGPTQHFYQSLIPEFDGMPAAKETMASLLAEAKGTISRLLRRFTSIWGVDALDDRDSTSAKNNSSAISVLAIQGRHLLFTGDAGITALTHAADWLDTVVPQDSEMWVVQIPHHGSRRNVGPLILNRLIGPPVSEGEKRSLTAIASTARKGEPKHPRKAVMNAFTHRGVNALATRGSTIRFNQDAPARDGWNAVKPDPYHWDYDDEE